MKTHPIRKTAVLLISLLTLAGCNAPTTSAERHAKHFTYAADDGFDPNFVTRKHESVKLSVPFFKQFWLQGKQDREKGISREEADKRVIYFSSDEFINLIKKRTIFAGKAYNAETPSPKWRKAMIDAVSGAYMDGYEGRN